MSLTPSRCGLGDILMVGYSVVVSVAAIIILSIIGGLFRVCGPMITSCGGEDLGKRVLRGDG